MKSTRTGLLAFVVTLGLQGCASTASSRVMSVDDVVRGTDQLEGRQITVRGVLHFYTQHGTAQLWASQQAIEAVSSGFVPPNDPAWDRCVDLRFRPSMAPRLQRRSGEYGEIAGTLYIRQPQAGEVNLSNCSNLRLVIRTLR